MDSLALLPIAMLFSVIIVIATAVYSRKAPRLSLPPGPHGLPILGSIFAWPKGSAWLTFQAWEKEFGEIIHVNMLGKHIIILGQYTSAKVLLDKSSSAGRPRFPMAGDLMGLSSTMILSTDNAHWRKMRKLIHPCMARSSIGQFSVAAESRAATLVREIQLQPAKHRQALRDCIGGQIIQLVYGILSPQLTRKYIMLAEDVLDRLSYALIVGSFAVDAFPLLKYLPRWLPGAHFQRHANATKNRVFDMINLPFTQVKKDMTDHYCQPSVTLSMLQSLSSEKHLDPDMPDEEHGVKWAAGSLYGAGMEPVFASMTVFILAMALNPSAQRKAQAELDQTTNKTRLPTAHERSKLPYLHALVQETLRWHPPIPLGVPHQTDIDGSHLGYHIPKDSTVFANLWAISRDENIYKDADCFSPDRFLGAGAELAPENWVFGFGRRVCVGTHYATMSLNIYIAYILQAFDIVVPEGCTVDPEFSPNTNSYTMPFPVEFVPRVDWIPGLVEAE
ncbi:cytochrome P450 [Mycena vulgaris]|nr:cytochrome P450 [Mycena vulgaris]